MDKSPLQKIVSINGIFRPSAPIDRQKLFAGRLNQLDSIIQAIPQVGRHVVLYGERGVGKTSLASILHEIFQPLKLGITFVRINCDRAESFTSLWRRILTEIKVQKTIYHRGMAFSDKETTEALTDLFSSLGHLEQISPDDIRIAFGEHQLRCVVILDEVDKIADVEVRGLIADTIKTLSDHASPVTIILVGVADSVTDLLHDHLSIERALLQVHMPRMSSDELNQALDLCLTLADMTINDEARHIIIKLSRGLPHYTHLFGLHAAKAAIKSSRNMIVVTDVQAAINQAIIDANESIMTGYILATQTFRMKTIHRVVLLACALAQTDHRGYFGAGDVKRELNDILDRGIEISIFARHLSDFASPKRGDILQRSGTPQNYRYRFINPLMQPYVIIRSIEDGLTSFDKLDRILE